MTDSILDTVQINLNQKNLWPLGRGFLFISPWERSELPFSAVLGEVKYKISVSDGNRNDTGETCAERSRSIPLWLTSGIVGFKKFFISKVLWTLGFVLAIVMSKITGQMPKIFKGKSQVFFVALLFMAFYNNRTIFIDGVFYVFWIVLIHNLIAFTTGFSLIKLFRLSEANVRSSTVETGIHKLGSGLLLLLHFLMGYGEWHGSGILGNLAFDLRHFY